MAVPDNFIQKELLGELVTLLNSHKLTRAGLPEWELNVSWKGVPLKLRVFQELEYELEKAGVSLEEAPSGSNWENNPLYFGTLGYDEKHNRLTLAAIKTPSGKYQIDLNAFSNRREKAAPEMPVLARKEAPKAETVTDGLNILEKAALIEKLALEILAELHEGKQASHAALIVMDSMAIQGKEAPKKPKVAPSRMLQNNPQLWTAKREKA